MNTTIPSLRSQQELLNDFQDKMRLGSTNRWTTKEFYHAMNEAMEMWGRDVMIPHIYTIPNGYQAGTYEYALPDYVRPPLVPQVKRPTYYDPWGITVDTAYEWVDVPAQTEPDGAGGLMLRPYAPPRTLEGRVIYSAPNSRVSTEATVPPLDQAITATSESLVLDSLPGIDPVGFVKIEEEYIGYADIVRGADTTTLLNLKRGLNDSVAASHDAGVSVLWCIAADATVLYTHLFHYVAFVLHRLFQTDGGVHERAHPPADDALPRAVGREGMDAVPTAATQR